MREKRKIGPGASLFLRYQEDPAFQIIFDILADKRPISWWPKKFRDEKKCHSKGENVFVIDQHIGKAALKLACLRSALFVFRPPAMCHDDCYSIGHVERC